MFNAAFLSGPVENEPELAQRLVLPSVHFNARGLEWAYWICDDYVPDKMRRRARRLFEDNGLRHSVDLPGMVAEHVLPPVHHLPAMEIRRVADPASIDAFCAVGSVCFHVPLAWFHEVFDSPSVWANFAAYVGYAHGMPVSTAAVVVGASVMGVYNVATLPEYQHRGYGEAVMRYALEDARCRTGMENVILQSTLAGLRLYQRMGFRIVTQVSAYAT
jgi:ribosomal protein S18 acetylase RimI-like enzyme